MTEQAGFAAFFRMIPQLAILHEQALVCSLCGILCRSF